MTPNKPQFFLINKYPKLSQNPIFKKTVSRITGTNKDARWWRDWLSRRTRLCICLLLFCNSQISCSFSTFLGNGAEFLLKFDVIAGALNAVCQPGDRGLEVHQLGTEVGVRWVEADGWHARRQRDLERGEHPCQAGKINNDVLSKKKRQSVYQWAITSHNTEEPLYSVSVAVLKWIYLKSPFRSLDESSPFMKQTFTKM